MKILIITAIIALLIIIVFVSIISFKWIKYLNTINNEFPFPFFINGINGDSLINIDEIESIVQGYNTIDKQYEIRYFLKSRSEIKETFNNKTDCEYRLQSIKELLNDVNC